jgi:hypothetical protein
MSGWRLACPACGAPSLLPATLARSGARVRCPGCGAIHAAADPQAVDLCVRALEAWLWTEPGGRTGVLEARAAGRFWQEHGPSLLAWREGPGAELGPSEVVRAALARVLGPGRLVF